MLPMNSVALVSSRSLPVDSIITALMTFPWASYETRTLPLPQILARLAASGYGGIG